MIPIDRVAATALRWLMVPVLLAGTALVLSGVYLTNRPDAQAK